MHGMLPSLAQFGGVWEDVLTSLRSIVESSSLSFRRSGLHSGTLVEQNKT